jgi:hypothetical protein
MRKLPHRTLFITLLLVASLMGGLRPAYACGPFAREAIFSYTKHPDFPLDAFARGQLGVLQPNYARSYLVVAYRYLNGQSFTQTEQQSLLSLWKERVAYDWQNKADDGKTTWLAARKKVKDAGPEPAIEVYRETKKEEYDYFLNCPSDAFETASQTLDARIKQFGAESAEVRDWLQAQDKVFANCGGGENIPGETNASAQVIRADRVYQIAAAKFYATRFDEARADFEKVAADSSSPWHETARYLIARTLIRKASLGEAASRTDTLTQAETQLKKTLEEIKQGPLHDSAAKLFNLVQLRLRPAERMHELAQSLAGKTASNDFKQDLWDYTLLLDQYLGDESVPATVPAEKTKEALAGDDLSDWLGNFQSNDKESFEHAQKRWQETQSSAWLVSALSKAVGTGANISQLIDAANRIEPSSPAFEMASYHAVRLLIESGKQAEARRRLDTILAGEQSKLSPSAVNSFLHQRMMLATSLEDFLKFAQRRPAAFTWGEDGRELPMETTELASDDELKQLVGRTLFDSDATRIMNEQFPLALLQDAASSPTLPEHLRKRIALAAWTRAVILDNAEAGVALARILSTLAPEMRALLVEYQSARTPAGRKAVALYTLLKFPGTRPFIDPNIGRLTPLNERDLFRDNWWCDRSPDAIIAASEDEQSDDAAESAKTAASQPVAVVPDFLSDAQRAAAEKERAALLAQGTAPNYLARETMEWARQSPNDPRVPEALHVVVMATRYGCSDKDTGALSKAAWQLLHSRYAKSVWAKKTPYWFKDS